MIRRTIRSGYIRQLSSTSKSQRSPLITIDNATIYPLGETVNPYFKDITWRIHEHETWAIVGPSSSGRRVLLEALQGKHRATPPSSIKYPLLHRLETPGHSLWPSNVIHYLRFTSAISTALYYSERYEAYRETNDTTLKDWILARMGDVDETKLRKTSEALGVDHLLDGSLMNLSNGQQRRARIVKALLHDPEILLLEDPYMGLDVKSRKSLSALLANLAEMTSPRILLALREQDHVPSFVTHLLQINRANEILHNGPKSETFTSSTESIPAAAVLSEIKSRNIESSSSAILADLKNVNISYWGKPVLKNVNWTLREGDHWLLLGPNGSGKTTLLSLLTGDNPKSYSQDITLFGRRRGTGETIFDIQAKIGHVSPELHYHFPAHRTAKDAILSGFGGTFAPPDTLKSAQKSQYDTLIKFFVNVLPERHLGMRFRELSTSHQRLVLLMRAFVKRPPLLILDEPYQGMDDGMIKRSREYLETEIGPEQAVIMVTHFVGEEAAGGRWGRVMKLTEGGGVEEIV